MNKTPVPKLEDIDKKWYVVDASDQILGRLATQIANILRGKNKPTFTPHLDTGDFVIVVNAEKVVVTGRKRKQKLYRRHSGRPGGMKVETFEHLQQRIPERIIEKAVKGMLPKNSLGRRLFTNLKVYVGPDHPHQAQKPEKLDIVTIPKKKKSKKLITMPIIGTPLDKGYRSLSFDKRYMDMSVDHEIKLDVQKINHQSSERNIAESYIEQLLINRTENNKSSIDLSNLKQYKFEYCDKKTAPLTNHTIIKFIQNYCDDKVYDSCLTVELDENKELIALNCTIGMAENVNREDIKPSHQALDLVKKKAGYSASDQFKYKPVRYIYFNERSEKWLLVYVIEQVIDKSQSNDQLFFPKIIDFVIDAQNLDIIDELSKA